MINIGFVSKWVCSAIFSRYFGDFVNEKQPGFLLPMFECVVVTCEIVVNW